VGLFDLQYDFDTCSGKGRTEETQERRWWRGIGSGSGAGAATGASNADTLFCLCRSAWLVLLGSTCVAPLASGSGH